MITTRLDYLQGKIVFPNLENLKSFLDCLCQDWAYLHKPIWFQERYENSFSNSCGLRGGFLRVASGYQCYFQLSGEFWSNLSESSHWEVIDLFSKVGFRCTRFDIALDDYLRRISPEELWAVAERGEYCLVNSRKLVSSSPTRDCFNSGQTIYFGSTNSQKIVRFYDAEIVHGYGADRWELQLRGNKASVAFPQLPKDSSGLAAVFLGAIDFRSDIDNVRFFWWQSFHDQIACEPIKFKVVYPNRKIDNICAWLDRQVVKSLAIVDSAVGSHYLEELIKVAKSEFSDSDRMLIESFKKEREVING